MLNDLNEEQEKAGETGIEIRQIKYLNSLVEQDHRRIKQRAKPMPGFQSFKTARRILKGVELCHMTRISMTKPNPPMSGNTFILWHRNCFEDRPL